VAAARNLDPPRHPIFQSQLELALRLQPRARLLAAAWGPASPRELRAAAEVLLRMRCRALLLPEAPGFLLALVFPLLSAQVWTSPFSWFCVRFFLRGISSSPLSVWAWAYGAVLILGKHSARASRVELALASQPPRLFLTLRLLILPSGSPSQLSPSEKLAFFSLIYELRFLFCQPGSETCVVSARTGHVPRFPRIDRGCLFVLH